MKELREATSPRLSVRAVAGLLEMPPSSYALYEDANRYKKSYLPVPFARKVAAIFAERGVDPADVMKLAGLKDEEAQPEAQVIEAQLPQTQFAVMRVELPSEAALTDMFASLLALVPEGASRLEAAKILAQRLPSGFAALAPLLLAQGGAQGIAGEEDARSRATDRRVPGQSSRT
ncbi:MAG TPA: XRE family transcriptional regulator [Sphingobium sp.]|uniref:XRE family transcriptional regulator n=1 Tax=Sphingobium sp. TaxID=1912891 RepID=UPI002ED0E0D9